MTLPRGVRNNNPCNLRKSHSAWLGKVKRGYDAEFETFTFPFWGYRAAAVTLLSYKAYHDINTVRGIIERWAPPSENPTKAYEQAVAQRMGVGVEQALDLREPFTLVAVVCALSIQENGLNPDRVDGLWHELAMIEAAVDMALGKGEEADYAKWTSSNLEQRS